MQTHTKFLIVGAGPTGLGAAWRLDSHGQHDWLLLESELTPGGLARSYVDEHGFTWDLGGHVQFSHYAVFDDLMDDLLGLEGWFYHDRESWVWICGRFVPYPFQLNIHRLPDAERSICLDGIERVSVKRDQEPANFGEWMDAAFGVGISGIFMRPYNMKVWARPAERMSWHWIGDRVATVDLDRIKANIRLNRDDVSWGPNNRFRFPKHGGTGAVWSALAARLQAQRGDRMRFGAQLIALDTLAHMAHFASGETVRYERLLTTIPLDELVFQSDLGPDLGWAAEKLEYSSTHVIGVGLRGQPGSHLKYKCWMYFPEANCPFYRVTHFSHYSPYNVPDASQQWSLMAEVSESPFKSVDSAHVVDQTVEGFLATGLIASRSEVHHTWHIRLEHGYPVPTLLRDDVLRALMRAFEARDVFSRGRFGAWKYEVSNQDHSFAQGVEVVDRWINGQLEETLWTPEIVNARRPGRKTSSSPSR
jgi:protoporphyrinogen oxidase